MSPLERSAFELLSRFEPTSEAEAAHKVGMLELLSSALPFSRQQFAPGHFTASAFVLSPEQDHLLLILHKKLGLWLQPGGHLETSDLSFSSASEREIEEEVGLTALAGDREIFDLDVHRIPAWKQEEEHFHFDVRFLFIASSRACQQCADEVAGLSWVPLDAVSSLATDESVRAAAKKLRERTAWSEKKAAR